MSDALYNESLNQFVGLEGNDVEILNDIIAKCPELVMPDNAESFDHWLDKLNQQRYIVVLSPDERDARTIASARRSGKPVVSRTRDPEPTAPAPVKTVAEYLAQRGESREAAVQRVVHRLGQPGTASIATTPPSLPDVQRPLAGKVVA
jgi:hypothetical protein